MDVIPIKRSVADGRQHELACLDGLRAAAALAVVMLHAGVPYLRYRMPGLVWPAAEPGSLWVDAVFWSVEMMVMPMFLVIAGFLMWRSSRRSTPGRLVRSRAKRLLIPFVFAAIVILPIDLYLWTLGLVADGTVAPVKLKSLKFEPQLADQLWGTSHLWFLLYVFLYVSVAALGLRWFGKGLRRSCLSPLREPRTQIGLLLAIACGTLAIRPEVVWGFQHAFLPVPSKWLYSGAFFAAGCVLAAHDGSLHWVQSRATTLLALSAILLPSGWLMGTWYLGRLENALPVAPSATVCLALLTVGAAGAMTFGLIGGARRVWVSTPKTISYLAAASFWVYLVHHPLVGLVHIDLKWLWPQGPPLLKMLASFSVATTISLATYECWVRHTRFGVWLGMADREDRKAESDGSADASAAAPAASEPRRHRAA
jgi:peptidoglycan/LPS O-acetylase OafA/YrhL